MNVEDFVTTQQPFWAQEFFVGIQKLLCHCCRSKKLFATYQSNTILGSGCGAVGRAVASNTRGPGFESSHRQLLLNIYLLLTVCRKDEK